jgi:hypothetical protein
VTANCVNADDGCVAIWHCIVDVMEWETLVNSFFTKLAACFVVVYKHCSRIPEA